jgi:hypothetical protein
MSGPVGALPCLELVRVTALPPAGPESESTFLATHAAVGDAVCVSAAASLRRAVCTGTQVCRHWPGQSDFKLLLAWHKCVTVVASA